MFPFYTTGFIIKELQDFKIKTMNTKKEKSYRIRVEQRPDEKYRRYYPEYAFDDGVIPLQCDQLIWLAVPIYDTSFSFDQDFGVAAKAIDNDIADTKGYTVEIIPYPSAT
jgi:hypothetical protein